MSQIMGMKPEYVEQLEISRKAAWEAVHVRDNEINVTVKHLREALELKTFNWQAAWFGGIFEIGE